MWLLLLVSKEPFSLFGLTAVLETLAVVLADLALGLFLMGEVGWCGCLLPSLSLLLLKCIKLLRVLARAFWVRPAGVEGCEGAGAGTRTGGVAGTMLVIRVAAAVVAGR